MTKQPTPSRKTLLSQAVIKAIKALCPVIVSGNGKGGVGKSTWAFHMAAAAVEMGIKTLIIDMDEHLTITETGSSHPELPEYAFSCDLFTSSRRLSRGKNQQPGNAASSIIGLVIPSSVNRSHEKAYSGTVLKLHPDECYEMENPRTVFDDALLNSIVEDFRDPNKGQQEAIYVYPADENGKYRVQIGATRLHAGRIVVKENPDFRLKAIIDTAIVSKDESEQYFERGMSNIKRNNMTLRDRANFIADYLEKAKKEGKKITQADVAERLGLKNSSAVSRLLKLRFMSAEVESLYNTGVTTDIDTLASLVDIQQENPALFSELIALPEIERSTVRQAKKNGTLKIVDPEEAESTAFKENEKLAHAQNSQTGSSDDEVVTIAYVDYIFKTGTVNLLIKQTSEGFLAS
ncbi:KorB domain-containing protein, partial [Citrobacter freundii]|uniref:KorB domain-containing protein n=1 Tax=Citrobacter freundii TaxID=546 RepID=UPI00350EEF62